jgi:hypothetical protein
MEEDQPVTNDDVRGAIGCGYVIGIIVILGLLNSIASTFWPDRRMERCIESCGTTRTAVYEHGDCRCGGEP